MRSRTKRSITTQLCLFALVLSFLQPLHAAAPFSRERSNGDAEDLRGLRLGGPQGQMALRAAGEPGVWELMLRTGNGGDWEPLSDFTQLATTPLPAPSPEARKVLDGLGGAGGRLLIGSSVTAPDRAMHIVGVAGLAPDLLAGENPALETFFLLGRFADLDRAVRFAETYVDLFGGSDDEGRLGGPPTECGCEDFCLVDYEDNLALCALESGLCIAAADAAFVACALGCGGVPVCEGACVTAYLIAIGICSVNLLQCRGAARSEYTQCLRLCDFP